MYTMERLVEKYNVNQRTIYRWLNDGFIYKCSNRLYMVQDHRPWKARAIVHYYNVTRHRSNTRSASNLLNINSNRIEILFDTCDVHSEISQKPHLLKMLKLLINDEIGVLYIEGPDHLNNTEIEVIREFAKCVNCPVEFLSDKDLKIEDINKNSLTFDDWD